MDEKDNIVTEASKVLWNEGIKILQGRRFADTDHGHVVALSHYMGLNGERQIADMGCGFGEVARLLGFIIPGAKFWLVNNNEFQITKCPRDMRFFKVLNENMLCTSIPDSSVDLVMFNFSLCLVDACKALDEAARITKSNGKLFVYDYERIRGNNWLTQQNLFANFLKDKEFRSLCADAGWMNVETIHPLGDDTLFREAVGDDRIYDAMFDDLKSVIWRAKRES